MKNKIKKMTTHLDASMLIINYETETRSNTLEVTESGGCDLNDLDEFCMAYIPGHTPGDLDADQMVLLAKKIYQDHIKCPKTSLHSKLTNKVQELFFTSPSQQGSPCIKLTFCDFILEVLSKEAAANNRTIQNEIMKRLRATFFNDIEYRVRITELQQSKIAFSSPKKYTLFIDRDMVDLLAASALVDNRTLDEEVLFRLLVSFVNPTEMGLMNHYNALIRHHITNEEKERQIIAGMATSVRVSESIQNNRGGHA
ncbi:MAG: hypothetical protein NTV32_10590 [Gammaproteobacteria bacterium]|nr:hypothetical protein [Gammaproteobacteria bacterium]